MGYQASDLIDATTNYKDLQTVHKALDVLELLNRSQYLTASEIARRAGLPRSTTCRIISTLERRGYLERAQGANVYQVSSRVHRLSQGYDLSKQTADIARSVVQQAKPSMIWPLEMSRLDGLEMETMVSTDFDNPYAIVRRPCGTRYPVINAASGRIAVASLESSRRSDYLSEIGQTYDFEPLAVHEFRAAVQVAEAAGFAVHQETRDPEKTIAVPVIVSGSVIGALAARFIPSVVSDTQAISELLPQLKAMTKSIISGLSPAAA